MREGRGRVAVIGGGFAGCAAAVDLARAGHAIELHEAATAMGGRARAVMRDDLPLDNGQHLLLAAYHETLALAAALHAPRSPFTREPLAMQPLAKDQPNALTLRALALPGSLGIVGAVLGARGLHWHERASLIRWFARQRRCGYRCAAGATVATVLADVPARVRDALWGPLCIAALNTPAARASGQVFLNVLRETFGAGARATSLVTPQCGLPHLVPEQARTWLLARGHSVRTRTRSRIVAIDDDAVVVQAGTLTLRADAVVVAVGPHQLAAAFAPDVIDADQRIATALAEVARFTYEPITTVYLGYAERLDVARGLTRLDDAPGQWLFDRRDILRRALPDAPPLRGLLSVVVSAHAGAGRQDGDAIATSIAAQLKRLRPGMPAPCWSQVVSERRATYACTPGLERPACGALGGRVYLAGDYTYLAFPATLEAAVRSGIAAARAAAADLSN
jgi:hydroxysqualene dehydroxylase